jgi:hypothetical protein
MSAWAQSIDDGVAAGFILPADADKLKTATAGSTVGRRR